MSPFGAILIAKARITWHSVASVRRESKLKVALVATSIVVLWVGAFALAKFSRAWHRFGAGLLGGADLSLVELLIPRVLSIFALVLFVLLVFSNALLTHATLYRSREVLPLLASPLSFRPCSLRASSRLSPSARGPLPTLAPPSCWPTASCAMRPGRSTRSPCCSSSRSWWFRPRSAPSSSCSRSERCRACRASPSWCGRRRPGRGARLLPLAARRSPFRETAEHPTRFAYGSAKARFSRASGSQRAGRGTRGEVGEAAYCLALLAANALFFSWLAAETAQRVFHHGWSDLAGGGRRVRWRRRGGVPTCWRGSSLLSPRQRALAHVKDIRLFCARSRAVVAVCDLLWHVAPVHRQHARAPVASQRRSGSSWDHAAQYRRGPAGAGHPDDALCLPAP